MIHHMTQRPPERRAVSLGRFFCCLLFFFFSSTAAQVSELRTTAAQRDKKPKSNPRRGYVRRRETSVRRPFIIKITARPAPKWFPSNIILWLSSEPREQFGENRGFRRESPSVFIHKKQTLESCGVNLFGFSCASTGPFSEIQQHMEGKECHGLGLAV